MTNDDLKRFYSINASPEMMKDFARYDKDGMLHVLREATKNGEVVNYETLIKYAGGPGADLVYKGKWVSRTSYQQYDLVYEDFNDIHTRIFYMCTKAVSGTTPPHEDVDNWSKFLEIEIPQPIVDQTFDPTSENAQSGTAVNEAISTKAEQSTLNDEVTARTSADSALQTNIDAEATTRATNDAQLQANINTLQGTKQNVIDNANKLNADYVDDSASTNKFTTTNEKATWGAKSTVSVSDTGTATDELPDFITINNDEYKVPKSIADLSYSELEFPVTPEQPTISGDSLTVQDVPGADSYTVNATNTSTQVTYALGTISADELGGE